MPSESFFPSLAQSVLHFFYPPVCVSCRSIISHQFKTLCQSCFESLKLLSPANRCRLCFHPLDEKGHRCHRSSLQGQAVCFDDSNTCRALLFSSASALAPFILMQWHQLHWPVPDIVIPTPGDWFSHGDDRWLIRKELARSVAELFGKPFTTSLRLHRHLLPKHYLSLEQQPLPADPRSVKLSNLSSIVNMNILLIHDVDVTGQAQRLSAEALISNGALKVWGISVISVQD
jgi:predicted amidophosphoribosyltransferase